MFRQFSQSYPPLGITIAFQRGWYYCRSLEAPLLRNADVTSDHRKFCYHSGSFSLLGRLEPPHVNPTSCQIQYSSKRSVIKYVNKCVVGLYCYFKCVVINLIKGGNWISVFIELYASSKLCINVNRFKYFDECVCVASLRQCVCVC